MHRHPWGFSKHGAVWNFRPSLVPGMFYKPMDVFPRLEGLRCRAGKNWRAMVSERIRWSSAGTFPGREAEETERISPFFSLQGKKLFLKGAGDLRWSTARKFHNWFEEKRLFSSLS